MGSRMPYRDQARQNTRYLRFCLDVLTSKTPCDVPWGLMDGRGCARVCPTCRQEVTDVTEMSAVDAEQFLASRLRDAEHARLDLHRRPDGRVVEKDCPAGIARRRHRYVFAAIVATAAAAAALAIVGLVH